MASKKGLPSYVQYFCPLIEVLKELGGSGTISEIVDRMVEKLQIPESVQERKLKNGTPYITNQIAWARFYLAKAGWIDSSQRGIWSLSEKGFQTTLTDEMAAKIFKDGRDAERQEREQKKLQDDNDDNEHETTNEGIDIQEIESHTDYRTELLSILKNLHPSGFERLCQRLLRESGFQQVFVTGKTGDGGIDGHGILQVNPFVSFNVLFQCKRYQGAVSSPQIRDFRGAMIGRTDKGIFITTGTFTSDARQEARREGAPQIELVDGEKLLDMFEQLELGLIPKKTFDIDSKFFDEFR